MDTFQIRKGKVHLDRRNARYLVEENIREDANYDLKVGLQEYYEEVYLVLINATSVKD